MFVILRGLSLGFADTCVCGFGGVSSLICCLGLACLVCLFADYGLSVAFRSLRWVCVFLVLWAFVVLDSDVCGFALLSFAVVEFWSLSFVAYCGLP